MNFIDALRDINNSTTTGNGAPAYKSTNDSCLDFFGGSSRTAVDETVRKFKIAFSDSPETAMRILFYFRDVRGGQGERKFVHACLKSMSDDPRIKDVIELLPEYGYWKDLMIFHNTPAWEYVVELIGKVLIQDMDNMANGNPTTLLAKWMPSANAGKASKNIANDLSVALGYTERQYRKILSALRKHIDIVESKMCSNEWGSIKYEAVPSRASSMYADAFTKHDGIRYRAYIAAVNNGETKINAGTLTPCEIVAKVRANESVPTMNALWRSLPNYMDKPYNGLVIADTSGSMNCSIGKKFTAMDVSLSLAMYISERNPSQYWKNKFIVFSSEPQLFELKGNSVKEYMRCFPNIVSSNTNLIGVAKMIVKAGTSHSISDDDMPKILTIVSDMQFDSFDSIDGGADSGSMTPHQKFSKIFTDAGYTVPSIVYWNVNNVVNVPIKSDAYGTALITGYSPSILQSILGAKTISPFDIMIKTVYNTRYDPIGNIFSK